MGEFKRKFFDSEEQFTHIGKGEVGGKAHGLINIHSILEKRLKTGNFPQVNVSIPRMTILRTGLFDDFMSINNLHKQASSDLPDNRIAHAFVRAELPASLVGDLYALISKVKSPLAVRSSSLLEDDLHQPFAGVYATKMIANNQFDTESRFHSLTEAIKFVYASTYFSDAKNYMKAIHRSQNEEKMAVIIQEVVGNRYGNHFYPDLSGVGRSYNYYTSGHAEPEEGVVSLALGLGKTIVDEGISWNYSPAYPKTKPPYNHIKELLDVTQRYYWAINMGRLPVYDPVNEIEYLSRLDLNQAEEDGCLKFLASTYDPQSDRLYPGLIGNNPRILDFSPILQTRQIPLNELLKHLLDISTDALQQPVEIEFALTFQAENPRMARFGFLQVRPMMVSHEVIDIEDNELDGENVLVASDNVLGNGYSRDIQDVVHVKPEVFDKGLTPEIASQIGQINRKLVDQNRPYLLIGFGRWGSSDPWLGIPVNWGHVAGARVIVESTLPEINVELSQGSHFFHNLASFQVKYFSVKHSGQYKIDWKWLANQEAMLNLSLVKHVKLKSPLTVKIDGRKRRGVILK